eukprot:3341826-Prymnesium_polylepis.1
MDPMDPTRTAYRAAETVLSWRHWTPQNRDSTRSRPFDNSRHAGERQTGKLTSASSSFRSKLKGLPMPHASPSTGRNLFASFESLVQEASQLASDWIAITRSKLCE